MAAQWRVELVQISDESGSNDIIELIDSPSDSHNILKFGEDHAEEEFSQHNMQSGQETGILVDDGTGSPELVSQMIIVSPVDNGPQFQSEHHLQKKLIVERKREESKDSVGVRKSERERRQCRSYSPEPQHSSLLKKRRKKTQTFPGLVVVRPCDKLPDGRPFCCDICKSPYVCNSGKRGHCSKRSKHQPSPRHKIDPATGKELILCNTCGLAFDRPKKFPKEKPAPPVEEKEKYMEEARRFALSLVEGLSDPDADRLACPTFKNRACGCMQQFIIGDGNMEDSRKRATHLLQLLKEAKRLSTQKCYTLDEPSTQPQNNCHGEHLYCAASQAENPIRKARGRNIGLGNGHKRSKNFEEFVLVKRRYLREELKLCERASQRVLMYSNNFLHKKLKTESRSCRALRVKGKAAMGLLKPISDLPKEMCCVDNCVMLSLTHTCLLEQWRERATASQMEARRVLAEMLTPSGGARSNCYRFISWVTGCSHSTIGRVNDQMKRTRGNREPPAHGLRKYWQENAKKKTKDNEEQDGSSSMPATSQVQETTITNDSSNLTTSIAQIVLPQLTGDISDNPSGTTSTVCTNTLTSLQIQAHRQQILLLQRQLAQQQLQLQQQQQLLQQQLLHQVLIEQLTQGVQPTNIQVQSLQQLLNQQLQQPQQVQSVVLQPELQLGTTPQATTPGQVVTLNTGLQQQQQLQQLQQQHLQLQQQQQLVRQQQEALQQQLSKDADHLAPTSIQIGGSSLVQKQQQTLKGSAADKVLSSMASATRAQPAQNSPSYSGGVSSVDAGATLQQILELSAGGVSATDGSAVLGGVGQLGTVNYSQAHTNGILSHLSDFNTTIAPNVNIALIQQQSPGQIASMDTSDSSNNGDIIFNPSGLGPFNCTILTLETPVSNSEQSNTSQSHLGQLTLACSNNQNSLSPTPLTSPISLTQPHLHPSLSVSQAQLSSESQLSCPVSLSQVQVLSPISVSHPHNPSSTSLCQVQLMNQSTPSHTSISTPVSGSETHLTSSISEAYTQLGSAASPSSQFHFTSSASQATNEVATQSADCPSQSSLTNNAPLSHNSVTVPISIPLNHVSAVNSLPQSTFTLNTSLPHIQLTPAISVSQVQMSALSSFPSSLHLPITSEGLDHLTTIQSLPQVKTSENSLVSDAQDCKSDIEAASSQTPITEQQKTGSATFTSDVLNLFSPPTCTLSDDSKPN